MRAAKQPLPGTPIVDYDPYTEGAILEAHRCDGALRDEAPVAFLRRYGIWAVSGHEECKAVLADHETFSSAGRPFDEKPGEGARPGILVTQDPPEHTRARAVLHRTLSPRRLRQMRDMFEAEAGRQLDALLAHGSVEVDGHEDLAQPFVLTVFPDLLGLPQEGRDHLRMFGDAVFNAAGPHNEIFAEKMQSASKAIACVDHRASEGSGFVDVDLLARERRDERRELDVGVAPGHDVTDDRLDRLLRELLTVDLRPKRAERIDGPGVGESHEVAVGGAEREPCGFGETRLVGSEQAVRRDVERCHDRATVECDEHT